MNLGKFYITPKKILIICLSIAVVGMIIIVMTVNRMNYILNQECEFNKDSLFCIDLYSSSTLHASILDEINSFTVSSQLPGLNENTRVRISRNDENNSIESNFAIVHHNYFSYLDIKILGHLQSTNTIENSHIWIDKKALNKLGYQKIDEALGSSLILNGRQKSVIVGVVESFPNFNLLNSQKTQVYEISNKEQQYVLIKKDNINNRNHLTHIEEIGSSFQVWINKKLKIWEDILYSGFLIIIGILIIVSLGLLGNRYSIKREKQLIKVLGVGLQTIFLLISKSYFKLLLYSGIVGGPLTYLVNRFWFRSYSQSIRFGFIDMYIGISIIISVILLICYPSKRFSV